MATENSAVVDERAVDSRWWYVVAATPVVFVVTWVFGIWFVAGLFLGVGFGFVEPGVVAPLAVVAILFGMLVGLLVTVMLFLFPIAIYLDAEAVTRADVDWNPDSVLYGLAAAVSAVATGFSLSVPVALYYLWQRHEHVGVP
ncbi:hypothetical protein [Halomicrococcus gelatinilyticus]|uniref:hypothetical protein n=1 Tax=Halomicrococcus gelatinilyticus TaxID=1702103 RepID=UPI002E125AA2